MQEIVSGFMRVSCFEHKIQGIVRTLVEGPGVAGSVGGWEEGREGGEGRGGGEGIRGGEGG